MTFNKGELKIKSCVIIDSSVEASTKKLDNLLQNGSISERLYKKLRDNKGNNTINENKLGVAE